MRRIQFIITILVPDFREIEKRMFFNSSKIVGWNIKIVGISQYYIRVTSSICGPDLIKGKWQAMVLKFMHEF
jgi:hypothetical protein